MTEITIISTPTPNVTPRTEINVIVDTKVRLGLRYLKASCNSNGRRDMARMLHFKK